MVANELRAKEGRKAAKAQKGKFWKKKEDDVLQKRKRKKKKGKKDPPPFPVLLCFDRRCRTTPRSRPTTCPTRSTGGRRAPSA